MILLKGHSLERKAWFRPESMSLTLEERNSTASLTLGPEAPEITMNDWLRDDTEPGQGVIYRVKTVTENVETRTRTVALEHVIQGLKDLVLFGEHTPATITGDKKATSCTAAQAARYALKNQGEWKLGDVEENPSNPYSFNGDTVLGCLETITASLKDVQWEYDLSSVPFTLHIRKQPTGFQSEMRMSRNITSLRRQIDRSRMYTRIYPIGKNNLKLDGGGYLSKNEGLYGIVCKVETDQSLDTKAKLKAWAQERLDRHCEPLVTDTITGLDLSRATGEKLDKITVGRRCRVPLPEYGTSLTERVVKLSWRDKIREPERMEATLANQLEDVASIVNSLIKSGGGGGRAAAKNAEEDHAWLVDTTEKVGLVAEAVAGPGADKDWSRVSSIFADGTGLHGKVTKTQDELTVAETRIEANEDAIRLEAERRIAEDKSLMGRIQVESDKVGMVVGTKAGENFIKAGEICVAINKDGSSTATIEASKIHLLGETIAKQITAEYIQAKIAQLASLSVQRLVSERGGVSVYSVGTTTFTQGGVSCYVPNAISSLRLRQEGNSYILQRQRFNDKGWVDVGTFSRAVASWDQSWSGGNFTAKAQPQGQSCWTAITKGSASWSGRTVTIPILAYNSNSPGTAVNTGYSASETFTAAKSDISASRGNWSPTPQTSDDTLTSITQNGYYLITVNACGAAKTFRVYVNVA